MDQLRGACEAVKFAVAPRVQSTSGVVLVARESDRGEKLPLIERRHVESLKEFFGSVSSTDVSQHPVWNELSGLAAALDSEESEEPCSAVSVALFVKGVTFLLSVPERVAEASTEIVELADVCTTSSSYHSFCVSLLVTCAKICSKPSFCKVIELYAKRGLLGDVWEYFARTLQEQAEQTRFVWPSAAHSGDSHQRMHWILNHSRLTLREKSALLHAGLTDGRSLPLLHHTVQCFLVAAVGHAVMEDQVACAASSAARSTLSSALVSHSASPLPLAAWRVILHEAIFAPNAGLPPSGVGACAKCLAELRTTVVRTLCKAFNPASLSLESEQWSVSVGHALTYALMATSDLGLNSLITGSTLSDILSGVSKRFDNVRSRELRRDGARIATLYATRCIRGSAEGDDHPAPVFDEFPGVLDEWIANEEAAVQPSNITAVSWQSVGRANGAQRTSADATTLPCKSAVVLRNLAHLEWPLNAEAPCPLLLLVTSEADDAPSRGPCASVPLRRTDGGAPSAALEGRSGARIAPYGKTTPHVPSPHRCGSLQQIHQRLCVPVPQQNESERCERSVAAICSIETVLGDADPLRLHERSDVEYLVDILLAVLHANDLPGLPSGIRESACVACLAAAPASGLKALRETLSSGSLTITQKVDIWRCIHRAALKLSATEAAHDGTSANQSPWSSPDDSTGQLYPPINQRSTAPRQQLSAGNVRWRSKRLSAGHSPPTTFRNVLADFAEDFLAMVFRAPPTSNEIPFVDLEMLRTIDVLLRALWCARHVVVRYAPALLDHLRLFTSHVAGEVRALAWMNIGLLFEVWRGEFQTHHHVAALNEFVEGATRLHLDDDPMVRRAQVHVLTELITLGQDGGG